VHAPRRKPYSIGYLTKLTGINASTLRSWEKAGLLAPAKSDAGRRTYDVRDARRVQEIDRLRRIYGYSLKAVKHVLEQGQGQREEAHTTPAQAPERLQDMLGPRVRTLRTSRGMSLRELANKAGVAASYMSMFERGSAYPSPSHLNAIARAMGLTLADLLGSTETGGRPIIRKGDGRMVGSFGPGVSIEQLTVGEQLMDCEIWTIQPGAESEGFYTHAGQELIHVLAGTFEFALDGQGPETLHAGDSAYFDSTRQHRWRNPGREPAVLLWVNTDADRLSMLEPKPGAGGEINIGAPVSDGLGERVNTLTLGRGAKTYRVVDTHTAGHPTRIILEPLQELAGRTVRQKRDDFRARLDHLRPLILHEPRGHAATFGLVPTLSDTADFGAIFVSSYKYLDMCGHGTIGYARALEALGRLNGRSRFTLEVPAGVVTVHLGLHGSPSNISIENVPSYVASGEIDLGAVAPGCRAAIAYGGCWYANVDAAVIGVAIEPDNVSRLMSLGAAIKAEVNPRLGACGPQPSEIDSVLFYEDRGNKRMRQLVILESTKFDRSPCGTGLSARMAQLFAEGRLEVDDAVEVENVLGVTFLGRVLGVVDTDDAPAIRPEVTGSAHLSGFSTLILEADDPLPGGFLCR
jgi:proline racemase